MPSSSIDCAWWGLPVEEVVEWKSSCSIAFVVLFARVTRSKVSERSYGVGLAICVSGGSCVPRRPVGTTIAISPARVDGAACSGGGDAAGGCPEARRLPYVQAFVCHAFARRRVRHSHGPGAPRPCERQHDDGSTRTSSIGVHWECEVLLIACEQAKRLAVTRERSHITLPGKSQRTAATVVQ